MGDGILLPIWATTGKIAIEEAGDCCLVSIDFQMCPVGITGQFVRLDMEIREGCGENAEVIGKSGVADMEERLVGGGRSMMALTFAA